MSLAPVDVLARVADFGQRQCVKFQCDFPVSLCFSSAIARLVHDRFDGAVHWLSFQMSIVEPAGCEGDQQPRRPISASFRYDDFKVVAGDLDGPIRCNIHLLNERNDIPFKASARSGVKRQKRLVHRTV